MSVMSPGQLEYFANAQDLALHLTVRKTIQHGPKIKEERKRSAINPAALKPMNTDAT